MEKEILIETEKFEINFYPEIPEDENFNNSEVTKNLKFLALTVSDFLESELSISLDRYYLNINLVDDERIIEINSDYRNKPKVTDVLSFPLQENIRNDEYDKIIPELELGDLFVCHSVCVKQAQEFNLSYIEELLHLIIHGFLHLCGYDHEINESEEKLMESLEEKLLKKISELRC